MRAADQYVGEPQRHLPLHRVHHLRLDLGAALQDRLPEPALFVDEVQHGGAFGAIARDEVLGGRLADTARQRRAHQHVDVGGLAAGQREPVGRRRGARPPAVELAEAGGDPIDHVPSHHPIRRQLAPGDRDQP